MRTDAELIIWQGKIMQAYMESELALLEEIKELKTRIIELEHGIEVVNSRFTHYENVKVRHDHSSKA